MSSTEHYPEPNVHEKKARLQLLQPQMFRQTTSLIVLLIVLIFGLSFYIGFNLDDLARDSGHLVKVYQQAQR